MKSLREQFDDLFKDEIILCVTEEKAKQFVELARFVGYRLYLANDDETFWFIHKRRTVYSPRNNDLILHGDEDPTMYFTLHDPTISRLFTLKEIIEKNHEDLSLITKVPKKYISGMRTKPKKTFVGNVDGDNSFYIDMFNNRWKVGSFTLDEPPKLPYKVVFNEKKGTTTLLFGRKDSPYVVRAKHDGKDKYDENIGFLVGMVKSEYYLTYNKKIKLGYERYNVYKNNLKNYFETLIRIRLRDELSAYQLNKLFDNITKKDKLLFVIDGKEHEIVVERKGKKFISEMTTEELKEYWEQFDE